MKDLLVVFGACVLFGVCGCGESKRVLSNAEVVRVKSIPLSIELDFNRDRPTVTSLYIKCNMIEYKNNIARDIFASTDDPQTLMFKDILTALQNKDMDRVLGMVYSSAGTDIAERNEKLGGWIGPMSRVVSSEIVGKDFEKLYIPRQLFLGDDRIFIKVMYMQPAEGSMYGSWNRFKGDSEPKLWDYWEKDEYISGQISWLVAKTDHALIREPGKVEIPDNVQTDYEFLLPCSTPENPVYLQFNGKVYDDFDLLNDTPDKDDEVLKFYQDTFRLLENKEYDKFADCYTEDSKAKILKVMQKRELKVGIRKIRFILDADPLFIAFTNSRHDYIIRSEDDGKFKLTHFGYHGKFEGFISNKELFRKPVLDIIIGDHKKFGDSLKNLPSILSH